MRIIKPYIEYWEPGDPVEHVCRCAQVSYQSKPKTGEAAKRFYGGLVRSGHVSCLRHESHYYVIRPTEGDRHAYHLAYNAVMAFRGSPYISMERLPYQDGEDAVTLGVSTNANFLLDNGWIREILEPHEVTPTEFRQACPELVRHTFCLTTQIGTARELNRCSPNCITEMSTRYVRMGDKTEPAIVEPHWLSSCDGKAVPYVRGCEAAFETYGKLLDSGVKPEDARGVLPLDTMTRVVYTYNMAEWRHLIDLRYYGVTGKAHPNARIIMGMVKEKLGELGYEFEEEE